MNTVKRANFKSGDTSSSKVRSDTVKAVRQLSGEQIKRLEGIVKQSWPRYQAYHGVYSEEDLPVQAESALRRKPK
ncbi:MULTISPECIES: hypothetical protein [unclassified Pseudoxanthomonas]|uniref:hypothetical protein n=1 Tax=unclassified Pseudoxanthomonas TaxID=2645906 RepID=UPI0030781A94